MLVFKKSLLRTKDHIIAEMDGAWSLPSRNAEIDGRQTSKAIITKCGLIQGVQWT